MYVGNKYRMISTIESILSDESKFKALLTTLVIKAHRARYKLVDSQYDSLYVSLRMLLTGALQTYVSSDTYENENIVEDIFVRRNVLSNYLGIIGCKLGYLDDIKEIHERKVGGRRRNKFKMDLPQDLLWKRLDLQDVIKIEDGADYNSSELEQATAFMVKSFNNLNNQAARGVTKGDFDTTMTKIEYAKKVVEGSGYFSILDNLKSMMDIKSRFFNIDFFVNVYGILGYMYLQGDDKFKFGSSVLFDDFNNGVMLGHRDYIVNFSEYIGESTDKEEFLKIYEYSLTYDKDKRFHFGKSDKVRQSGPTRPIEELFGGLQFKQISNDMRQVCYKDVSNSKVAGVLYEILSKFYTGYSDSELKTFSSEFMTRILLELMRTGLDTEDYEGINIPEGWKACGDYLESQDNHDGTSRLDNPDTEFNGTSNDPINLLKSMSETGVQDTGLY